MTIEFSFFDPTLDQQGQPDRVYNAQQFTNYFKSLVTTGIMRQHEDEMLVSADGTTMQTSIGKGTCFIEGRQMIVTAPHLMLHDTESVGLKRIDRIVVRLDLRVEARHVMPFIKKGVASANPVAPTLQRDSEVYEICLATVTVTGGRSYITNADIVDDRANEELCGWTSSDIFPNYNDATLQAVLTQVQESNNDLAEHMNEPILHTPYGIATGTNAKAVNVNLPIAQLVDGMAVVFKNQTTNTGAVTLNVNALGAKGLIKSNGLNLVSQELKPNSIYTARYNATNGNFILQGEGSGGFTPGSNLLLNYTGVINDRTPNVWSKTAGFKIGNIGGVIRMRFITVEQSTASATYRFYKNGVPFGIEHQVSAGEVRIIYEDLTVNPNDQIDLYVLTSQQYGPIYQLLSIFVNETLPVANN